MICRQCFKINPRLLIEAFCVTDRYQFNQILITCCIFTQQHQMIWRCIQFMGFIKSAARCHIYFTADNRLNSFFFTSVIKIHCTIHTPMVCNGNGILSQFFHAFCNIFDAAGSIKQTVFCMKMQMDKISHKCLQNEKLKLSNVK